MAGPATLIGVYARVSGVWQRINGGTPTGFSGPQTRSGGLWRNSIWVHAYASGWQVCWTNINGEIPGSTDIGTVNATDFDVSPYNLDANVVLKADGSISRKNNSITTHNYSAWRDYDCGRDYQWHVLRDVNYSGTYNTVEPTLSTWTDFTGDVTFACAKSGVGFLNYDDGWAYYVREKVRADPLGSVPRGDVNVSLGAEI